MRDSTDGVCVSTRRAGAECFVESLTWCGAFVCTCVCLNTRFDCIKLGSNPRGWFKSRAGICSQSWCLLSGPSSLSKEVESWRLWSQILSYWAMFHVRDYWNFRYLLLPCLKYCLCPAPFISTILDFALSFIHTRTYWNAWKKASF